jgi:hypothetical protein
MKILFASFAALTMTATEAAQLHKNTNKHSSPVATTELSQAEHSPLTYANIMENVKSLEKAYEYHKTEEKLLNEINAELQGYMHQASDMMSSLGAEMPKPQPKLVQEKHEQKQEAKVVKALPKPVEATQVKHQEKVEAEEEIQLGNSNYLQLSSDDLTERELQQIQEGMQTHHKHKVHHKMEHKMKHKTEAKVEAKVEAKTEAKIEHKTEAKIEAKVEHKMEHKMEHKVEHKMEHKVEHKTEQKAAAKVPVSIDLKAKEVEKQLIESKAAEKAWMKEMSHFKAEQKAKAEVRMRNEALAKLKAVEAEQSKLKLQEAEQAKQKAKVEAEIAAMNAQKAKEAQQQKEALK